MSATPRALIVVTSCSTLGMFPRQTGFWMSEVTHFQEALGQKGIEFDIASPRGGKPPLDEASNAPRDKINRAFLDNPLLCGKLDNTLELAKVDSEKYNLIYFAGGHGAMGDFVDDPAIAQKTAEIYHRGGFVASVCHGASALLGVKLPDGKPLVEGKRVTGFANTEEALLRLTKKVPFSLEDELRKRGAIYRRAFLPFTSHVESDQRLITGQNPQSSRELGQRVVAEMNA
jgi:putative intracellular protease/amidase